MTVGTARRMGLARQLWTLLAVPLLLALGLYGAFAHNHRHRVILADDQAELADYAILLDAAMVGPIERQDFDTLRERMERVARADRILGIALFDVAGTNVFTTREVAPSTPELAAFARRALAGSDLEEEHAFAGRPALVRSVIIRPRDRAPYCAVIVRDLHYLGALFAVLDRGLLLTGLALIGLTLGIVAFVSRVTVVRPAQAIVRGVERVAAGDLDVKVPEEGAEEVARLAAAFNAMTLSLAEARKRVEAEVSARGVVERRLQQAQALAAAGQVAASLGHEIGSPLNVILGRAQRAAGLPGVPDKVRLELETIAVQSERISRVVGQLLAVVRPQRKVGRGCDLLRVVEDALGFVAPELKQRRVRARTEAAGDSARIALDADRAFQIVFNLVMNAAEAQKAGGEIFLRIVPGPAGPDGTPRIVLEVEDRGPGVPKEKLEHLFEPFFTTKGDSGGSGLGLAIVQGIVREAGGTMEVRNLDGGGALFRASIPEDLLPVRSNTPLTPDQARA
jgi:signal transduction histidine kinase